jgi:isopenicillin N synthase-like dioxygenase
VTSTHSGLAVTSIPVVSLAQWRAPGVDRAAFAAELIRACHEVGFFTLVDHGIEQEAIDAYFAALQAFFALPEEVKAEIEKVKSPHFRGWERVGAELTDNRVDYREQLDLSTENPAYAPDSLPPYLRLDGPNQWLPDDVLPGFRDTVTGFLARVEALANELMEVLATGLGLGADTFRRAFGERPLSLAKLISYPPTPEGEAGVNSHHDAGFLTLLLQHEVGGLQVLSPDDEWIDVPPRRGAFVVNLGEMLQSMTGNYLIATTHRVISREPRFSAAYFHGPDLRASLAPLDLDPRFAEAVAASPRHRDAGFMAKRDELLAGESGTRGSSATVYGEMLWNYYVRSYPDVVRRHYPELM